MKETKKGKRSKGSRDGPAAKAVDDDRFMDLTSHPMFREPRQREKKVVVDERFKAMLTDPNFAEKPLKVDKRGRPIHSRSNVKNEYLDQLYEVDEKTTSKKKQKKGEKKRKNDTEKDINETIDVEEEGNEDEELGEPSFDAQEEESEGKEDNNSDDEEEEEEMLRQRDISIDLARGEGNLSSSSSDDSEDDEQADGEIEGEEDDPYERLERGIRRVEWASSRIAICNLEWERLRADDLLLVLNSFKPTTGVILSVAVYLSDFGAEQLEKERAEGGPLLDLNELDADGAEMKREQVIRAYELDKLRYYYAVVECDSEATAIALYESCDGVEYEESGVKFDLRFIPPETEFQESRLRERVSADDVDLRRYKSKKFRSFALTNSKTKLTWDENDPDRERFIQDAFKHENDLDAFDCLIAPESEDEEELKAKAALLLEAAQERSDLFKSAFDEDEDDLKRQKVEEDENEENLQLQWDEDEADEQQSDGDEGDDDNDMEQNQTEDGAPKKRTTSKSTYKQYLERKKEKKREKREKFLEKKRQRKMEHEKALSEQAKRFEKSDVSGEQQQPKKRPKLDAESDNKVLFEGEDERFSALVTDSSFAIDKSHPAYKGGDLANRQVRAKVAARKK